MTTQPGVQVAGEPVPDPIAEMARRDCARIFGGQPATPAQIQALALILGPAIRQCRKNTPQVPRADAA